MLASQTATKVIVVGASAGGVEALRQLVGALPHDLLAAILVVLHVPAEKSELAALLHRISPLPAKVAEHGEARAGRLLYSGVQHERAPGTAL
jgi:two-component system, chemotaxis family, protein-glutamate methylesterase/glutaminase